MEDTSENIKTEEIRILLTGGGTGGHVYPLLAVAEQLRLFAQERDMFLALHYYGPKDRYQPLLLQAGIKVTPIVSGKLRRYVSFANVLDVPKFFFGLVQAFYKMFFLMPDVIFTKGGPGALPVVLAGWFYRIPIVVHESDAFPGLTNSISSRFAAKIFVSFEKTLEYFKAFNPEKISCVGSPIRQLLLKVNPPPEKAKKLLGFDSEEPLILVVGGSQGSRRMNDFIVAQSDYILSVAQVLHQTGKGNYSEAEKAARATLPQDMIGTLEDRSQTKRYRMVPYLEEDMPIALTAADLVVGRAGSGTIFEIAAFGKPAILIPLPESANNHQKANAYEFAKGGAAVVIEEQNLLPGIFLNQLKDIFSHPHALQNMKDASSKFFKADAASLIAQHIFVLAGAEDSGDT